jgi:DNA (cytosine-5)-methyltransferase 1
MGALKHLPDAKTHAHKALGNAVNVEVIRNVATRLLQLPDHQTGNVLTLGNSAVCTEMAFA